MMFMTDALLPRKFNAVPVQDYFTKRPEIGEIFYLTLPGRAGLHIFTADGWNRIITHHQYISELFSAEKHQVVFVLTKAKYVTDGTGLQIFKNGKKLPPQTYFEADQTTVVLKDECDVGDQIEIIVVNSPHFSTEIVKDSSGDDVVVLSEESASSALVNDIPKEIVIAPVAEVKIGVLTIGVEETKPIVYESFTPTIR